MQFRVWGWKCGGNRLPITSNQEDSSRKHGRSLKPSKNDGNPSRGRNETTNSMGLFLCDTNVRHDVKSMSHEKKRKEKAV
jgi:hypothetical protein